MLSSLAAAAAACCSPRCRHEQGAARGVEREHPGSLPAAQPLRACHRAPLRGVRRLRGGLPAAKARKFAPAAQDLARAPMMGGVRLCACQTSRAPKWTRGCGARALRARLPACPLPGCIEAEACCGQCWW